MEEEAAKAVEQVQSFLPFIFVLVMLMSVFIAVSNIRKRGREEEEEEEGKEESTKDEVGIMADEIRKLQRQKR